jgi:hypothetical protein
MNVYWSSSKVPLISVGFKLNLNILERFYKNNEKPNFIKIRSAGAELLHVDKQI